MLYPLVVPTGAYQRILDLRAESRTRSIFLFGPRQTGKTHLLRKVFPNAPYYNLLLSDQFLRLSARPQLIREELDASSPGSSPVIIDEIQKLPILLDEVHALIEGEGRRFILTGSGPRKLVRGGANLLGGRARTRHLLPLVSAEIGSGFDVGRALRFGTLPSIYGSDEPWEDLAAYCGSYLQEEIQAEGAVRRIERFSRFLQVAALMNGELVSFESAANDAGVPARTIREYFQILKETLVGVLLEPYRKGARRKPVATSKFYFFDVGVANRLSGRSNVHPGTESFGRCLEHLVLTELRAYLEYRRDERPLTFWRTRTGDEVDFMIGDEVGIEVKATTVATERDLRGLRRLGEEVRLKHRILVSMDARERVIEGIRVIPTRTFLERLWQGEL